MLTANHFLYDPAAAIDDRIMPLVTISPQEVWDHLWPQQGADHVGSVTTRHLMEAAKASAHFPVMPEASVLWQALQEGAREHRWVLYLRGPNLAIGAQEIQEWPGTPRFDEAMEMWTYQAALDQGIYPRPTAEVVAEATPLTLLTLRSRCWPSRAEELETEDLERHARGIWRDLSRPHLETVLRQGVREGSWAAWRKGADEMFFTQGDSPEPAIQVSPVWVLVDPASPLAHELDALRPGRGPQPVTHAGTPREVLTQLWETLGGFRQVQISEITLTVNDRDAFDNTLLATWADRPEMAQSHTSVMASGQREVSRKQETVRTEFEGRFEEVRAMLSPVWPFKSQGELGVTITVRLTFIPPVDLTDAALENYRTALMNANHGEHGGLYHTRADQARGRRLMERFRLRVRHEPKRGQIWELHLFPQHPHRPLREADGRILGSSATPAAVLWLRQIAGTFLSRAEAPGAISAEAFGPQAEPRWLMPEDGMRLALAFSAARWLATPQQRRMFREGLEELPSEVVLYWFTLCFYGYRQSAGRAALRTFLTHEEPAEQDEEAAGIRPRKRRREKEPTLFSMTRSDLLGEGQESHADDVAAEQSGIDMTSVGTREASGMTQQPKAASSGALKRSDTRPRKTDRRRSSEPGVREDQSIIS